MEHLHQIVGKFVFGWFKHTFFVEKKKFALGNRSYTTGKAVHSPLNSATFVKNKLGWAAELSMRAAPTKNPPAPPRQRQTAHSATDPQ